MIKNAKKHFWHYVVYAVIFAGGLQLVLLSKHEPRLQAMYIVLTTVLYFIWSLVHHYVHHQLHTKVIFEYVLVVVLGVLLSLFLFQV